MSLWPNFKCVLIFVCLMSLQDFCANDLHCIHLVLRFIVVFSYTVCHKHLLPKHVGGDIASTALEWSFPVSTTWSRHPGSSRPPPRMTSQTSRSNLMPQHFEGSFPALLWFECCSLSLLRAAPQPRRKDTSSIAPSLSTYNSVMSTLQTLTTSLQANDACLRKLESAPLLGRSFISQAENIGPPSWCQHLFKAQTSI